MMKTIKSRADVLLAEQGLAESREKAKRLVMAGQVWLLDPATGQRRERVAKPGQQLPADAALEVDGGSRFVSRGGYKLLTALEHFSIDPAGWICLDVGASTGGFTDCLLQFGAAHVYAVDVGHGQLDPKIRNDPRVTAMERVNMRHATSDLIPEPVDFIVADVSFISLTKVLPACMPFLKPGGMVASLVKPQFEVGPGETDKGVVRDERVQRRAVDMVADFCARELNLSRLGDIPSAVKGPKGNQEYLLLLRLAH